MRTSINPPEVFDALSDPIILGTHYGYSTRSSAWTTVTVGRAVSVTPTGRVTMVPVSVKTFLYGKPADTPWKPTPKTTSILPRLLFPVSEEKAASL